MLGRRGFRMRPWAVEWDEAAVDFLIEQGFSAELGARPLKRAVEQHVLTRIATAIVERQFPEGDQFLFITAREGTGLDVAFVDPDAEVAAAAAPVPDGELTLARIALDPEGSEVEAAFLRGELTGVAERARAWDSAKVDALEEARDPAFWESEDRHRVLGLIEYLDRLGAATATAERLGARLGSQREGHSRELVQLLAIRLHVLAAALAGLDAREASDATLTVRSGHADDADACERFVQELEAMYVGWADGRGMRIRRNGANGEAVLEISGLGAYTLLKSEAGLHVLELPHDDDRGFDRVTALVEVDPAGASSDGNRGEPGDRAPLPPRALAARPRRLGHAHRPDRPRARRRLRPARRRSARLAARRASRGRSGSRPSRPRGRRPAASRPPSPGRCRACSSRRPRRSRRRRSPRARPRTSARA